MGKIPLDIEKVVVMEEARRPNQGSPLVQNGSTFVYALIPKPGNGNGAEEQFPLYTKDIENDMIHLCRFDKKFGIFRLFDRYLRIWADYEQDEKDIVSKVWVPEEHYKQSADIEDVLEWPHYTKRRELFPQ